MRFIGIVRRAPFAIEAGATGIVLGLYLQNAFQAAVSTSLYLGGDTTRDAARIVELLRTGHFSHQFGVPYESGYFSLAYIPFITIFGNTILALQAACLFMGSATVLVLYAWLRRMFGLLPALCVGSLYATSPLLHAHFAVNAEMNIPLMLGLVMLLRTCDAKSARTASIVLSGFFTSCDAYFLFPFTAYLCAESLSPRSRRPTRRELLWSLGYFLLGFSVLGLRFILDRSSDNRSAADWYAVFSRLNAERWRHPMHLLQNFWAQWAAGLSSYRSYMPWRGPAPQSWVIWAWLLACAAAFKCAGGRRWVIGLAAGLLGAALVQSVRGVGLRHMLVFLPLQWACLAALISSAGSQRMRIALAALCAIMIARQDAICASSFRGEYAFSDKVLLDTDLASRLAAMKDDQDIIVEGTSNAFFCLKYLAPGRPIDMKESTDPATRTGVIRLRRLSGAPSTKTTTLASRLAFNDGVAYAMVYERPAN